MFIELQLLRENLSICGVGRGIRICDNLDVFGEKIFQFLYVKQILVLVAVNTEKNRSCKKNRHLEDS